MHNLNIKLFCLKGLEFIGDCEWCCTCYRVSDENGSVNYRMDTRHFIHIISSLCAVNFIMEQGLPATQKSDVALKHIIVCQKYPWVLFLHWNLSRCFSQSKIIAVLPIYLFYHFCFNQKTICAIHSKEMLFIVCVYLCSN